MPMMWSRVDLPAPEGPMIDTNSPSRMSRLMRRSTHVRLVPCAYDFSRFRRLTSASMAAASDTPAAPLSAAGGGVEREKNDMAVDCTPLAGGPPPLTERLKTPAAGLRNLHRKAGRNDGSDESMADSDGGAGGGGDGRGPHVAVAPAHAAGHAGAGPQRRHVLGQRDGSTADETTHLRPDRRG